MTREDIEVFTADWAGWWNSGHIEKVLNHFHDDVVFVSPRALDVTGSSTVRGKEALRAYWTEALDQVGRVEFTVDHFLWDSERQELAIIYTSEIAGGFRRVSENLRFNEGGMVVAAEVFHGVGS